MRTFRALLAAAALLLAVTSCRGATHRAARPPGQPVTIASFHDALAPYGRWMEVPPHGWVWTPDDVSPAWRPYTDGCWVYTDYGWTWASYEPWGWATYHYGRWRFDPSRGWLWVPGTGWGPAWVAWHHGDPWVGWAPLPPPIEAWVPDGSRLDERDDIAPTHWSFLARRHLGSTRPARHLVSPARNVTLLARTREATRFAMRDGRAVNLGPDITLLERQGGIAIPRKRIVEAAAPPRSRGQLVDRDVIRFYRPEAHRTPPRAPERVRLRELRLPGAVERWQQEAERRRLEQALVRERGHLVREHARELRTRPGEETIAEIRRRQDAEQQAFETHAGELRQVLEGRLQARDAARAQRRARGDEATRGPGRDQGA